MKVNIWGGAVILTLTGCTIVAHAAPAFAQPWAQPAFSSGGLAAAATAPWASGYNGSFGYRSEDPYRPAYNNNATVAPGPTVGQGGGGMTDCEARFRSYDPATAMYLGYDGLHHPCP